MRKEKPLLVAVAFCAVAHATGILVADPLWRYAEVLSLVLLLAYAVVSGLPQPRWAVPVALALLLVDAVRTMSADPDTGHRVGQVLRPGSTDVGTWAGFEAGLTLCWASSAVAVVLLVGRGRAGWLRWQVAVATVAATLVVGYAVVRVVDVWLVTGAEQRTFTDGADVTDRVLAVGLGVLPPVVLGVTALALAAALAGYGRWLASAGAVLLALVALPHLDASIGAVPLPLPLDADGYVVSSAWQVSPPRRSMLRPVPALTAAVELTAYLLLVVGLTGARGSTDAAPAESAGSRP